MPRTSDPSYLQPLHQFRPTKPSHGFTRIGLGRFRHKPKTPGRFQTYLLFTMYSEQASSLAEDANFYFFKRIFNSPINPPIQAGRPSAIIGRPVWSAAAKPRQRQDITSPIALAIGGAERDRTADPLLAKQVLSQLSYSPIQLDNRQIAPSARQHNHIASVKYVQACQAKTHKGKGWWARVDLNYRPHAYQACALTN